MQLFQLIDLTAPWVFLYIRAGRHCKPGWGVRPPSCSDSNRHCIHATKRLLSINHYQDGARRFAIQCSLLPLHDLCVLCYRYRNSVILPQQIQIPRVSHSVPGSRGAVVTMPIYLIAMISPLFSSYEGYFLPVNFIFSYLWLTSFIFSATDWSGVLCREAPLGKCSLKRTVESFNFILLLGL
ncbi:hypothetical protein VFPPC_16354 [Pochonia chlamydosporia 170]|uniref:Uncharacterized protein n=1 Tax=Pochonia chlamydosporia 170 TaxID=1380566 RepID=A0A179FJ05_METCM|nr:hypothetical protein VFPPC_16354 [Pochonia chlamydosporia 170]OAQ65522.1 hypothetical protein VFPPC_16354 [Pochonia chlamydosporia 170]